MNGKKLALVLGLIALVIAIPAGYVLAHPGGYYSVAEQQYQDEDWWQEMRQYMEQRWDDEVDDQWWSEMREHMEDRWVGVDDEDWHQQMQQYREEHWQEVQDEDWYQEMEQYMEELWDNQDYYGRMGGYGGYGGCHGWGR